MKIDEVIRGLQKYVARVRVDGVICQMSVECGSAVQARLLLTRCYGASSVLSVQLAVLEENLKPVPFVKRAIKPLTPKQWNKKATADQNKWVQKKQKVSAAQKKIQADYARLADINRGPA